MNEPNKAADGYFPIWDPFWLIRDSSRFSLLSYLHQWSEYQFRAQLSSALLNNQVTSEAQEKIRNLFFFINSDRYNTN